MSYKVIKNQYICHFHPDVFNFVPGDGKELAAQEVIIADLPREMLQCDLFTLCREFVNPLEIQLYKIDGDNM